MCSSSTKDKIKLQIIIFCVKHNREQTITLEFKMGHGPGGCDMIYLSIVLISAIKYSCTIYKYINITQGYQRNKKYPQYLDDCN